MVCTSRVLAIVVLALVFHAPDVRAQARIEAVQYPAWLERDGVSEPLMPGTSLRARDTIATGAEGRAAFRLAEGTVVKLAENTRIELHRDELAVRSGAFRLTSLPGRRDEVAVRLGGLLVLGRGADLFGESGSRHPVMLIAGRAKVNAPGQPAAALERPFDRYAAAGGSEPVPASATAAALDEVARRVEMDPEGARAAPGGRWRVLVGKFVSGFDAQRVRGSVRAAGFPAELVGGGAAPYVVMVPGFAGEAEARAAMARLRSVKGAGILTVNQAR